MRKDSRAYIPSKWRLILRRNIGIVVFGLAATTLICGLVGFSLQYRQSIDDQRLTKATASGDWSIPLYKTIQLFLLNSGAEDDEAHASNGMLVVSRISASLLFLLVSSAVIIRILDEVRRLPKQWVLRDHIVICGLGDIGLGIFHDLCRKGLGEKVIFVESDTNNCWIDFVRSRDADVIIGDCSKPFSLLDARVSRASQLFLLTPDDALNLESLSVLNEVLKQAPERTIPIDVYVHIRDTGVASILKTLQFELYSSNLIHIHVFSVQRNAATSLISHQLCKYAPTQSHEVAQFVLIGFGSMGQQIALQLAGLGHFPNRKRSRFIIVDDGIQGLAREFLSRYPRFTSWSECQLGVSEFSTTQDSWEWNSNPLPDAYRTGFPNAIEYVTNTQFVDLPHGVIDQVSMERILADSRDVNTKTVVFVCTQEDKHNFQAAIRVREILGTEDTKDIPIFVWIPQQHALAQTLSMQGFFPFGQHSISASYDEITNPSRDAMGAKIHDDYERQMVRIGERSSPRTWAESRYEFKESSRSAADHMHIKLAYLGLQLVRDPNPGRPRENFEHILRGRLEVLAEMEHYRWAAERLLSGWRFAPPGQNSPEQGLDRKENSHLVAWEHLGEVRKKNLDQTKLVLRECQNSDHGFEVVRL